MLGALQALECGIQSAGGPWAIIVFTHEYLALRQEALFHVIASFVFIVVSIMMGLLGLLFAGAGLEIKAFWGTTNAITIGTFYPCLIFPFMVFAGLVAISRFTCILLQI